jgi:hypothetical protein
MVNVDNFVVEVWLETPLKQRQKMGQAFESLSRQMVLQGKKKRSSAGALETPSFCVWIVS